MIPHEPTVLDDFLIDHPECAGGVRFLDNADGPDEPHITPVTLRVFLRWAVAHRGCDPDRGRAFWLALQRQHPGAFVGPPPV